MNFDLSNIDIYGIAVGLKYINKEQYQSSFGAIMTIIIGILISVQTILVGSELFIKQNPEVISSERYVASPERFTMKKDSFNFAFGLQFPGNYSHFIDNSIYVVEATQTVMTKQFNETTGEFEQIWDSVPIPLNSCKRSNFGVKETIEYFNDLPGMENMYCVDQDSFEPFMEGNFDQNAYSVIQIFFKLCSGDSNCKDKTELKEILTNSYVAVYSDDNIVNPKNISPYEVIGRDFFWNASPTIAKDITMYFRNVYVESDKGIFFEEKNYDHKSVHSYQTEQIIFDEDTYFFQLQFRFEKAKESVYHRTYKKLAGVLADIGGIAKALMMIGFIICMPINQLQLHSQLSNSLFSFKEKQEDNNHNIPKVKQDLTFDFNQQEINHLNSNNNDGITSFKSQNQVLQIEKQNQDKSHNLQSFENIKRLMTTKKKISLDKCIAQLKQKDKQYSQPSDLRSTSKQEGGEQIKVEEEDAEQLPDQKVKYNQKIPYKDNQEIDQISPPITCRPIKPILDQYKRRNNDRKRSSIANVKNLFEQEEKSSNNQLNMKWFEYIQFYVWPYGKFERKKKQITYSVEKIYQHLDMLNIIQRLLELEKLTQLLLDENQIKLIQFFPKPSIDIDEQEKQKKGTFISQSNENQAPVSLLNGISKLSQKEKAKEAFIALKHILKKSSLSHLDKKIISMVDKSILELIENHIDYLQELEEADINNNKKLEEEQIFSIKSDQQLNQMSPIQQIILKQENCKSSQKDTQFFEFPLSKDSSILNVDQLKIEVSKQNDHLSFPQSSQGLVSSNK